MNRVWFRVRESNLSDAINLCALNLSNDEFTRINDEFSTTCEIPLLLLLLFNPVRE